MAMSNSVWDDAERRVAEKPGVWDQAEDALKPTVFDVLKTGGKLYQEEAERIGAETGTFRENLDAARKVLAPASTPHVYTKEEEARLMAAAYHRVGPETLTPAPVIATIAGMPKGEQAETVNKLILSRTKKFDENEITHIANLPDQYSNQSFEVVIRNIYREPGPQETKDEEARQATRVFTNALAGKLQALVQSGPDQQAQRIAADEQRAKFGGKTWNRWDRTSALVVGGGAHLAEEVERLVTLGRLGDTAAEWADMYYDVLQRPEMQPVVDNWFDKYVGGGVEMSGPILQTVATSVLLKKMGTLPRMAGVSKALTGTANFTSTYGIESNLIYQQARESGMDETEARIRSVAGGLVNAGIEVRGGSGDKYLKNDVVNAVTQKLGRVRYVSKKMFRTALAEGLKEEMPQEAISMVLGGDTPKLEDGTLDYGKIADRLISAGVAGSLMGGLISAPIATYEAFQMPHFAEGQVVPVSGTDLAIPGRVYAEALQYADNGKDGPKNPWVKLDRSQTNTDRVLLVQFASDLLTEGTEDPAAKTYYDKLYASRPGYVRLGDTWEIPKWITEAANFVPNADVYFVRDMDEAKRFLKSSGYKKVMMSALDINTPFIQKLTADYNGKVVVGGYVDGKNNFPNATWYDSMLDMAKGEGYEYKPGVNLAHFEGSAVMPRLCMSKGCKHKCAFCVVTKNFEETPAELVEQQADAFTKLDAKLVYLDDKTFGQAMNHTMLPDLYWRIKKQNPEFQGFVVQTTAAQFSRFSDEFLTNAHIRYVEFGVESYNDDILGQLKKPHNTRMIDEATAKARRLKINVVPNIIIGLPQETAETYARTMAYLEANRDIISHVNVYNLALYAGTDITKQIGEVKPEDLNENAVAKSFHNDPQVHQDFAARLYQFSTETLDHPPAQNGGLTADQQIAQNYGVEPGKVEVLFKQAEERYRELKAKKVEDRKGRPARVKNGAIVKSATGEHAELAFLSRDRNNIEAILADLTSSDPILDTIKLVPEKTTTTRPKQQLLDMGHGMAQQLEMTEEERRLLMADLTGKNSMERMTPGEMEQYVQYLEAALKERGLKYEAQPDNFYEMLDQLWNKKRPDRIEVADTFGESLKKLGQALRQVSWQFARMDRFFEYLDGAQPNGLFKRTFFRKVEHGHTARNDSTNVDILNRDGFIKTIGMNLADMIAKRQQVNDHVKLTASERVTVFNLSLNEAGRQRLLAHGLTPSDVMDVYRFMGLTDDEIELLVASMVSGDRNTLHQIIDGSQSKEVKLAGYDLQYYENFWPVLKRVAISIGVDEATLLQEFMHSPIMYQGVQMEEQPSLLDLFEQTVFAQAGTEKGFLEQRQARVTGRKLELDSFVIFNKAAHDYNTFQYMAPVAYTLNKMLSNGQFGQALNAATQGQGLGLVQTWLKHSVRGHGDYATNMVERWLLSLRNSSMTYALAANVLSVVRQSLQLSNVAAADTHMLAELPRTVAASFSGGYKEMYDNVMAKSATVRNRRMEEFIRPYHTREQLVRKYKKKVELDRLAMSALVATDSWSVMVSWQAAYNVAMKHGLPDPKTGVRKSVTEQEAIDFADDVIIKNQSMADAVYTPEVMRKGSMSMLYKLMLPFTNQVNNNLNLFLRDNIDPLRNRGWKKGSPEMAYRFLLTWFLPALAFGMIQRGRFQRDPKELVRDVALYPVAGIFLVSDALMMLIDGEARSSPLYSSGVDSAVKLWKGVMRGDTRAVVKNGARTISLLGGMAAPGIGGVVNAQTIRSAEAAYDMAMGEEKPSLRKLIYGEYSYKKYNKEEKPKGRKIVR